MLMMYEGALELVMDVFTEAESDVVLSKSPKKLSSSVLLDMCIEE